jgi:hypothetical protein
MKKFPAAFDDLCYLALPYSTSEEKKSAWVEGSKIPCL